MAEGNISNNYYDVNGNVKSVTVNDLCTYSFSSEDL